jgi:hypothetical protein
MKIKELLIVAVLFIANNNLQAEQKHYIIGVEDLEYYPLWHYDQSLNQYRGLGRDILDKFARDCGFVFEYNPLPLKRLVKKLVEKEIDFKFPDNSNWAVDEKKGISITYSDPVIGFTDGVFVIPRNIGNGNDSIKTLGLVLGFTPWDWLPMVQVGKVKLKETPNFEALINQAISGHIDGAYANIDIVKYNLKIGGRENALVYDDGLSHADGSYAMSTSLHPNIIEKFNVWLSKNKEEIYKMKKNLGMQ